ncbi:PH domain-containing protein [Actinokineospora sp. NPDC004072]
MSGGWQRLDRRTLRVTAVNLLGVALVAAFPASVWLHDTDLPVAVVVAAGGVLLVIGGIALDWLRLRHTRYRVSDALVELRHDFVVHTAKSIPRERVRSVDIDAGPAHRLFGVVKVRIGTGQQDRAGEVITFDPLDRAVAERLRRDLLRRAEEPQPAERGALAQVDWAWLRYAPLSVSTPILGAAAFGAVMQGAEWFGVQSDVVRVVGDLFSGLSLVGLIAVLVVVGFGVGVVGSLGLFVEMWWNYRLTRESGALVMRRGLITTRSLSLEERRVRGLELVEPLASRLVGAARLDAVATGLRVKDEKGHAVPRTLAPAMPRELAQRIAAAVLAESPPPTDPGGLTPHPLAARRRRVVWAVSGVLVPVGVLVLLGALLTDVLLVIAGVVAAVGVPVAVALAFDAYRNLGHGLRGKYLVARSGAVRRRTVALQRTGVIGWAGVSSPFQRRLGLLNLVAVTSANSGSYVIPDVDARGLGFAEEAAPGILGQFLDQPEA